LENGSTITFSIAGHVEAERDFDDAVVIFGRKLLKYTKLRLRCGPAHGAAGGRLESPRRPLDKVPDVGTPTPPAPVKEPAKDAPPVAAPAQAMGSGPYSGREGGGRRTVASSRPRLRQNPRRKLTPPEGFSLCAECGEAVPANQAKLSQLFQGKTLCKSCLDGRRS